MNGLFVEIQRGMFEMVRSDATSCETSFGKFIFGSEERESEFGLFSLLMFVFGEDRVGL